MSIKNEPEVERIVDYTMLVLDRLERQYHVKLPDFYVADGAALALCANYIAGAWRDVSAADAAFVLCNKIQARAWENNNA